MAKARYAQKVGNYTPIGKPSENDYESILIDSTVFRSLVYQIKDNHIIIYGGINGTMAVDLRNVKDFLRETREVVDHYTHGGGS